MHDAYDRAGSTGCLNMVVFGGIGIAVLAVAAPLVWPLVGGLLAPGFNTCTDEIRKLLRDPATATFSPVDSLSSPANPHLRGYDIEVSATNGFGGRNVRVYRCLIDESGGEATYRIVY